MRRLCSLVLNLPDDAAVWREDAWPSLVELQATAIERTDAWFSALFDLLAKKPKVQMPGEVRFLRPGEKPETTKTKVEHDENKIMAFFSRHIRR